MIPIREQSGTYKRKLNILFDLTFEEANITAFLLKFTGSLPTFRENFVTIAVSIVGGKSSFLSADNEINSIELGKEMSVGEYLQTNYKDFDLIVTEDKSNSSLLEKIDKNFVTDLKGAFNFIEIFLRGNDIPWSFSFPMYNMHWSAFYNTASEIGQKATQKINLIESKISDKDIKIILRNLLLNKIGELLFTRDRILFYKQQRTYSKRAGLKNQDYSFELAYYLSFYYILISGMLDQSARILNNALEINFKQKLKIKYSNKDFVEAIKNKDKNISIIFNQTFIDWDEFLRVKRNFIAHEGSVSLSPLVKEPKKPLTDNEIERRVEAKADWDIMRFILNEEQIEEEKKLARHLIYIDSLEVVVDDIMYISHTNLKTKGKETLLIKPLLAFEEDFETFIEYLFRIMDKLENFLASKDIEKSPPKK